MRYFLFSIFLLFFLYFRVETSSTSLVFGPNPRTCDLIAAAQCEYEFLQCKLFTGPANDPATICRCGEDFYGSCLRRAGCEVAPQVTELSAHEKYMKLCIDVVMFNDCPLPGTLMCAVNCASDTNVDLNTMKIIPFNNYGAYYLRIRLCRKSLLKQQLDRFSLVTVQACSSLEDFDICTRFVPPLTFAPVALPKDITYIEVDSCELRPDGSFLCHDQDQNPPTARIYGNAVMFPATFDVAQSNVSICHSDANCLGSYCNLNVQPSVCSPKTLNNILVSGSNYFADPFN